LLYAVNVLFARLVAIEKLFPADWESDVNETPLKKRRRRFIEKRVFLARWSVADFEEALHLGYSILITMMTLDH